MGFDVKITTKSRLLDLFCPQSCIICGKLGAYLCDCCKKDILADCENYCPKCKHLARDCQCPNRYLLPPTFMVGWRDEAIGKIVQDYKYHSVREAGKILAEILDETLPFVDGPVSIVPLPTIGRHIRERGFDHTLYLAKQLSRRRRWGVEQLLGRANNSVQVGASEKARVAQAYGAYYLRGCVDNKKTYLLIDDVWTTGMSMKVATKMLQRAGASKVLINILAVSRKN